MKRTKLKLKRTKLKLLRVAHNLTHEEMANKLGRSRGSYIKIERGERNPTPDFWAKLQSEFKIPDEEMFSYQKGGDL